MNAETLEEIAVSIMSEIIQVNRAPSRPLPSPRELCLPSIWWSCAAGATWRPVL